MSYQDTHRTLIEACKKGKRQAQYELYQSYAKAMYNLCLRMLNNADDAEDILQESFIDVFTKLEYFKYDSSIGAWMKRIVINNCINFLKRRKLSLENIEDIHELPLENNETKEDSLTLTVENIKTSMSQLADGYRVILSLYLFEGYDHREIASILNISENTSKSQYSRAKKKLKAIVSYS